LKDNGLVPRSICSTEPTRARSFCALSLPWALVEVGFVLWHDGGGTSGGIEQFDAFYRKVRYAFNQLLRGYFVTKAQGRHGYRLNDGYLSTHLGV
jgi:hypothetical protein